MKFYKVLAGKYKSEDKRFEISYYKGIWEVYDNSQEELVYRLSKPMYQRKYLGYANTLRDAKKLCK